MSIRIYSGSEWEEIKDMRQFRGGRWQQAALRRHNGAEWEQLWPSRSTYTKEYLLSDYVITVGRNEYQHQTDLPYLVVGCSVNFAAATLHDSLLFFPMDELRADLTGAKILSASMRLTRLPKSQNDGSTSAYISVASALSGVDPTRSNNLWSRKYTLLRKDFTIGYGTTKTVPIDTSGVSRLLSGHADCICLPTDSEHLYSKSNYAHLDPSTATLIVTYYI